MRIALGTLATLRTSGSHYVANALDPSISGLLLLVELSLRITDQSSNSLHSGLRQDLVCGFKSVRGRDWARNKMPGQFIRRAGPPGEDLAPNPKNFAENRTESGDPRKTALVLNSKAVR